MSDPRWDATTADAVDHPTDAGDDTIEEKVAEIEQTREGLTATVEAIEDRLAPSNVIADAKQTVRDATVGRVEETVSQMTQTADQFMQDPARAAHEAGSGIVDTIRQNPLPSALIGVGIGWLVLSRGKDGNPSRYRSFDSRQVRGSGSGASWERDWRSASARDDQGGPMDAMGQRVSAVSDGVGRTASETADDVGHAAGQAAATVGRTAEQLGQKVGDVPSQASSVAQTLTDQASELVRSNPLGASLAALAVGTVVGMLLPATPVEHRVMGQASERLIEHAGDAATEQLRTASSDSAQNEALESEAIGSPA